DLLELEVAFVHGFADAAGDAPDHFVGAAVGLGADAGAADAVEFPVKHAGQDFGAAKIDANHVLVFVGVVGHGQGQVLFSFQQFFNALLQLGADLLDGT